MSRSRRETEVSVLRLDPSKPCGYPCPMNKLPQSTSKRSKCPIATALDVVGDKWTLLIVRDIGLLGRHRNKHFQEANEGITSSILANRLKSLCETNLVRKIPYQDNPRRYEYHLTESGEALMPILYAMSQWSSDHVEGVRSRHQTK